MSQSTPFPSNIIIDTLSTYIHNYIDNLRAVELVRLEGSKITSSDDYSLIYIRSDDRFICIKRTITFLVLKSSFKIDKAEQTINERIEALWRALLNMTKDFTSKTNMELTPLERAFYKTLKSLDARHSSGQKVKKKAKEVKAVKSSDSETS